MLKLVCQAIIPNADGLLTPKPQQAKLQQGNFMNANFSALGSTFRTFLVILMMGMFAVGCSSSSTTTDDEFPDGDVITDPLDEIDDQTDANGDTNTGDTAVCDIDDGDWTNNCVLQEGIFSSNSYLTLGVQRILWCQGFSDAESIDSFADGLHGPVTTMAIQEFQTANGLLSDGIVGEQTWGVFRQALAEPEEIFGDAEFVSYGIASDKCADAGPQFYQRVDAPFSWEIAVTPGSSDRVAFNSADVQ